MFKRTKKLLGRAKKLLTFGRVVIQAPDVAKPDPLLDCYINNLNSRYGAQRCADLIMKESGMKGEVLIKELRRPSICTVNFENGAKIEVSTSFNSLGPIIEVSDPEGRPMRFDPDGNACTDKPGREVFVLNDLGVAKKVFTHTAGLSMDIS